MVLNRQKLSLPRMNIGTSNFFKAQNKQFFNFNNNNPNKNVDNKKYYEILEVDSNASNEEIKKSFRTKAMKFHPDRGGDPDKFKELSKAYEVLSNKEKRDLYDQLGEEGVQQGQDMNDGGFDINDIFGGFGNTNQKRSNVAKDVLHIMKVSLEDVYNGATKSFLFKRHRLCKGCKGEGTKIKNGKQTCKGCNGKGMKVVTTRVAMGMMQQQIQCPDCEGKGKFIKNQDKCGDCRGEGAAIETKNFDIAIPKGVNSGNRIPLQYEGNEYPGVKAGNPFCRNRYR
jgi:DnaJ family protein A protein 2